MLTFFAALGARITRDPVYVPEPLLTDVARLNGGGERIFLPASRPILPGRPIVGIDMHVRDLLAARHALSSSAVSPWPEPHPPHPRIVLAPADTRHVWLERDGTAIPGRDRGP